MNTVEILAILKRPNKYDLFIDGSGNVRINREIFYRCPDTKKITGPITLTDADFNGVFQNYFMGTLGIVLPVPQVLKDEFVFNLILRKGNSLDFSTALNPKFNKTYYEYRNHGFFGPYIFSEKTDLYSFEIKLRAGDIYVMNEKQHFENRQQKSA